MSRVSIEEHASSIVEVDLWAESDGAVFETKPLTRSLQRQMDDFTRQIDSVGDDDSDQAVELIGSLLDLITKPQNGSRQKASTLLMKKWKADKVELPQILGMVEGITEALAARPT